MRIFFSLKILVKFDLVEKSRQESHKQTSSQEFVSSDSPKQTSISKQQSAASGSASKQKSAASGFSSTKTQKQTSKQKSAASGSGSTKTQKQMSIPKVSEDNGPFRLVVPSSLYSQQSRMVPPIRNVIIHSELMSITRTAEPYRSNVHIAEPYRSNVRTAKLYRRELAPIIREPFSSNWTRDVNDEMEVDEEEALVRPKILFQSMKPRYTPRYRQVKSWLSALHKYCRVRLLYKQCDTLDKDNHRLHRNNRLNEKKACRVKGAKSLFDKNDEKLENYDRKELLNVLNDNRYHSPEYSESDEEQPDGKRHINVYNPSWRSEELMDLLLNVLDQHAFSLQSAQLIRTRNYDDDIYNIVSPEDAEVLAEMDEIVVIEDSELTGIKELEPMGMEESEPMGVEESLETEDETDKWYKFVL
ncbi:hypothetical protein GLOIN_2v1885757 [Rhizophagus irregularis DAOM 181602=DAOM 197198]|nr:hypothetical protein GLOIN_2v1885757 [Rhizophagus irregularis DAOM 181602=DAOM 197198]